MAVKVSGIVITFNEDKNITRCIESMQEVCDEILVVDSFSTDATTELVRGLGGGLIQREWNGFLDQKNFAQDQASYDIVLQLDADEALSEELKQSILEVKENWSADGYFFNRFTQFCGKWIHHSGWYPDAKLRLYDRRKGKWDGLDPHPVVSLEGTTTHLKGDLLHYSFHTASDFIEKSASYALQGAHAMHTLGKPFRWYKLFLSPIFRFFRDFILRGGIRDGFEGLMICVANGYYTFLKNMYLRLLSKGQKV